MHPQIHKDEPGQCPICHMDLVPVFKEKPAAVDDAKPGTFEISNERQQLIGVKTVKLQRRHVVSVIRTTGKAAFDPDLAVAVREFVEIGRKDPELRSAGITRLKILGMGNEEISRLEKGGESYANLYLPEAGGTVWVYATVYQSEVRSIAPIVDAKSRSVRVRIEVPQAGSVLRPESYVDVSIRVDHGTGIVVPASAVVDTGVRQVVYVAEGNHFQARTVRLGVETEDGFLVTDGVKEGETVVSAATFMIDSESQLRASMAGQEHQHGQ
ncbi:MAG: hypothetical protein HY042_00955 [Spirochaetia bacterium]|nr:hypothetical protein [Spirochaetia bacterium]